MYRRIYEWDGAEPATYYAKTLCRLLAVLSEPGTGYSDLVEQLRDSNDSRIALQQNTDLRKIAAWAAVIAVPTAI